MKVTVPFTYHVNYKQPRRSHWEQTIISSHTDLRFVEIDKSAANIAFIVSDSTEPSLSRHSRDTAISSKFHVPGGECVIRQHYGQFYASRFPVSELPAFRRSSIFDPFNARTRLEDAESEFRREVWLELDTNNKEQSLSDFEKANPDAKKFTSERLLYEKYLSMMTERFAVIDGTLYEKVWEPVIAVVMKGNKVSIHIEEAISPSLDRFFKGMWTDIGCERVRFGLDEYERAIDTARELAETHGAELVIGGRVSSCNQMSVNFRGDHEYLFAEARAAVSQFTKTVRFIPEHVGAAVLSAANLLSVHDRLTPSSLDAVRRMDALLREYFSGEHVAPMHYDPYSVENYDLRQAFGEWQNKLDRLSRAIRHWDARDDLGHEWLSHAFQALPRYDYPRRAFEVTSLSDIQKIALRWKGDLPPAISAVNAEDTAVVVVEDFERRRPLSVFLFDRADPTSQPRAFANVSDAVADTDIELATAYVSSTKASAAATLSRFGVNEAPRFG